MSEIVCDVSCFLVSAGTFAVRRGLKSEFSYEDGQIRLDENSRPARRVRETLLELSLVVSSSTRDYRDMHLDGHKRLRRETT
jgi:hypothetical protein